MTNHDQTDDEIRQRILAAKAARGRSPQSNGHNIKILKAILPSMAVGKIYPMIEIEILVEKAGLKFSSSGPATSYAVREGILERVGRAQYRVTGKPLGEEAT